MGLTCARSPWSRLADEDPGEEHTGQQQQLRHQGLRSLSSIHTQPDRNQAILKARRPSYIPIITHRHRTHSRRRRCPLMSFVILYFKKHYNDCMIKRCRIQCQCIVCYPVCQKSMKNLVLEQSPAEVSLLCCTCQCAMKRSVNFTCEL